MSADTQARLLGDLPDGAVHIQTEGRVIRPAFALPAALVDECRLHVAPDGLWLDVVDPANVAMCRLSIDAGAFEIYSAEGIDGDELAIGLPLARFRRALRQARKGKDTSDPVRVDLSAGSVGVEVDREYGDMQATYADEVLCPEADAVREDADDVDVPNPNTATLPVDGFAEAIDYLESIDNHVRVGARDGGLVLSAENSDLGDGAVAFRDAVTEAPEPGVSSLLSIDYIDDIASALKTGLATELQLDWGDEFPVELHFARDQDGETLYSGRFMQAPRIQS